MRHEPHGQVGVVEHLVTGERRERHLRGRNGPEVVALEVVRVVLELGQVPRRHHGFGAYERRRAHLLERVGVAVERELAQGADEDGAAAAEHREHRARQLRPPLQVEDAERGPDFPVGHALMVPVVPRVALDAQHHVVLG